MSSGAPVVFERRALRDLKRLPARDQRLVIDEVKRLARGDATADVKKLRGRREYRLRIGDYRVLFLPVRQSQGIHVLRILPRDKAYR